MDKVNNVANEIAKSRLINEVGLKSKPPSTATIR